MGKTGFENIVDKLPASADFEKWEVTYDKQLDFLYWMAPRVSRNATMVKVSHETYLYLTPSGKIEGVLVEYLQGNFVEHNVEYKDITKSFKKLAGRRESVLKNKSVKTRQLFERFAEALRADIYRDAVQDKKSIAELEFVVESVVKKGRDGKRKT